MNPLDIVKTKALSATRRSVFKANRLMNHFDDVIWLIGDGRSGTTWVSDLINHDKKFREMFEPFHPWYPEMHSFILHQYARPNKEHPLLKEAATKVFTGKLSNSRVDEGNFSLMYRGLLIKDIFANLFAYWASLHFPQLNIVLLIRNPFSVALSKLKKKDWLWVNDPMHLFNQDDLREDYLEPFGDLIQKTVREDDYVLNQVLIWSIINYVPLRQFDPKDIHVVFYEDIHANPNQEISRILAEFSEKNVLKIDEETIARPSRMSLDESNVAKGVSPIDSWKKDITTEQLDTGLKIMEAFGLSDLYDNTFNPNRSALNHIKNFNT